MGQCRQLRPGRQFHLMVFADVWVVGQIGVKRCQHRHMHDFVRRLVAMIAQLRPAESARPQADAVLNQRPVAHGEVQLIIVARADGCFPLRRAVRGRVRRGIHGIGLLAALLPRNHLRIQTGEVLQSFARFVDSAHVIRPAFRHVVDVEVFQRDFGHPHGAVLAQRHPIAVRCYPLHLHIAHLRFHQRVKGSPLIVVLQLKIVPFVNIRVRQFKAALCARDFGITRLVQFRRLIDGSRREDGVLPAVFHLIHRDQLIVIATGQNRVGRGGFSVVIAHQAGILVVVMCLLHHRQQLPVQIPAVCRCGGQGQRHQQ